MDSTQERLMEIWWKRASRVSYAGIALAILGYGMKSDPLINLGVFGFLGGLGVFVLAAIFVLAGGSANG